MVLSVSLVWLSWLACTDGGFRVRSGGGDDAPNSASNTSSTTDSDLPTVPDSDPGNTVTATADTGEAPFDCSTEPILDTFVSTTFYTEEDFDFHPAGMLVYASGGNIVGMHRDGSQVVLAGNVGWALSGLRILRDGASLVIGDQSQGSVDKVTEDGSVLTIEGGLVNPRAIAADSRGYIYVSENAPIPQGRVRIANLETGQDWILGGLLDFPNGLALSPDEERLYLVAGESYKVNIFAADRNADGTFSDPWVFVGLDDLAFSLATDSCGYVYAADFYNGRIFRVSPDGSQIVQIADLPGFCCFSGMRFGNGVDGFERDHLYVTRREEVIDLTVGIPGKLPIYALP